MATYTVMIDGVKVDTAVVRDKSTRMRRFSNEMYDVLSAAKRKMNDMQANAVWLSAAGEAIIGKMNALQPVIERQRDVLGQYCSFLETTAVRYEDAEARRLAEAGQVRTAPGQ